MRSAILMFIGLMMGVLGSSYALNALHQKHAFSRGVMILLSHHHRQLKHELAEDRCDLLKVQAQLDAMSVLAGDVDVAFADPDDAVFSRYAIDFRNTIAQTRANGAQCSALEASAKLIGDACNACHRDYR